jgi:hypothetical protein
VAFGSPSAALLYSAANVAGIALGKVGRADFPLLYSTSVADNGNCSLLEALIAAGFFGRGRMSEIHVITAGLSIIR